MPNFSAAWMTVVPSATLTSRPSMLSLGMPRPQASGLAAAADERLKFVAELQDVGLNRPGSRVREDADGFPFHVAGDGKEVIQVLKTSLPFADATHNTMNPA